MVKATIASDSLQPGSITPASFSSKIESFLTLVGGTLYDSYAGSSYYGFTPAFKTYQIKVNNDPNYGFIYFNFYVNYNLQVTTYIYTAWDIPSHTGSNGSQTIYGSGYYTAASEIKFDAVYGADTTENYLFIFIRQGTTLSVIGYAQPGNPKAWVKPSSYFVLSPNNPNFQSWYSCNLHPFGLGNGIYNTLAASNSLPSLSNPYNNDYRDSFSNIYFFHSSGQGTPGRLSSDFVLGAYTGIPTLKTVTDSSSGQRLVVLSTGQAGLAVALAA